MSPFPSSVILGGAGAVGRLFASRLGETGLTLVDPALGDASIGAANQLSLDAASASVEFDDLIRRADLVIMAMPEAATLLAMPRIVGLLKQGALLVDTLSVKGSVCKLMSEMDADVEFLSINPMFAPDLGFEGRSVAAVEVRPGPASRAFLGLLRSWGSSVTLMSASAHDETAARTQALSHAAVLVLGIALSRQGYDCDAVLDDSPPPHRMLMALLARILQGQPATYYDIQRANPEARAMTEALAAGIEELRDALQSGGLEGFAALLEEIRQTIEPRQDELAEDCQRMFAALSRLQR